MDQQPQDQITRATTLAQRDHIEPIRCQRSDTGDFFWLVQSRSDPQRYYVLFITAGRISCQCPQSQHGRMCAHAAAVRLTLHSQQQRAQIGAQTEPQASESNTPKPPVPPRVSNAPGRRNEQQRASAERRERALLWTDDKPFSMWKS